MVLCINFASSDRTTNLGVNLSGNRDICLFFILKIWITHHLNIGELLSISKTTSNIFPITVKSNTLQGI